MAEGRQLDRYVNEVRPRYEDMLGRMVEIPSISMDPDHAGDTRRMAEVAVDLLKSLGAEAEVVETKGYPVVAGGWTVGPQYPTVTVYNHLDVQPAQEPEWRDPAFAFRKEDGVYRGRGATDDKGPALAALLAARYAMEGGTRLNIRFVWELEEEIGSPNFPQALASGRIPQPDSVVVSDTIWVAKGHPAMPAGLRGLVAATLSLRTGEVGAHSGVTGGAARNRLAELCALAHACLDAGSGRVKIPGFYDRVIRPTKAELDGFMRSGFTVNRFKRAHGFRTLRTSAVRDVMRRIWAEPTFEVHGLVGGYTGTGVKTVVPAWGELKVSMRLVPDQRPDHIVRLFTRFIKGQNSDVTVAVEGRLDPFRGVQSGPYAEAAKRAMRAGFGKTPVFTREGGSIGAVSVMDRAWRVPILFMGLSLPEHGYHAPNEYFDWGQAAGGMRTFAAYFTELANMRKS